MTSLPPCWPQPGVELIKHIDHPASTAHKTHLRTFLSFLYFTNLPLTFTLSNILAFLEYLYQNHISPKVIKNYLSSITTMAKFYQLDHQDIFHPSVTRYIRSISTNSRFQPTPGAFLMSKLCMPFRYRVTNSLTHPYQLPMHFCVCPM